MKENRKVAARRVGLAVVIITAIATGWYIGSQVDGDPSATPPGEQNGEVYRDVAGTVVRIDPEHASFTVDHEEIEGFMAAMVMDLNVAAPAELEGLQPDDEIIFDMARIGDTYKAVRIRLVDDDVNRADAAEPHPHDAADPPANPLGRGDLVPDLTLIDATGESLSLRNMEPRHKIVTFFYARCPLEMFCPAQAKRLAELQHHIERHESNVHLLSLTLDGEHDDPNVLAGYADRFDADPTRWTLARGTDPAAVRDFADRAGARIHEHRDSYEIDHALIALRLDDDRIVDRVYGLDAIEQLVKGMQ